MGNLKKDNFHDVNDVLTREFLWRIILHAIKSDTVEKRTFHTGSRENRRISPGAIEPPQMVSPLGSEGSRSRHE